MDSSSSSKDSLHSSKDMDSSHGLRIKEMKHKLLGGFNGESSFDIIKKRLCDKSFINNVSHLMMDLYDYFSYPSYPSSSMIRTFLISYVIIMDDDEEEISCKECAIDMLYYFDRLIDDMSFINFVKFQSSFNQWIKDYNAWKEEDQWIIIEPLIESWKLYNTIILMEQDKDHDEQNHELIMEMESKKNNVMTNIKMITGKNELPIDEYMEQTKKKIVNEINHIAMIAFWDVVYSNFNGSNEERNDQILVLLNELRSSLIKKSESQSLVNELHDTLNIELLDQVLKNHHMELVIDDLMPYFTYISGIMTQITGIKIKWNFNKYDTVADQLLYFFILSYMVLDIMRD